MSSPTIVTETLSALSSLVVPDLEQFALGRRVASPAGALSVVRSRMSPQHPPLADLGATDSVVTALEHAGRMIKANPRAAVCVVRAERQDTGLLITLVINTDIDEVSRQQSLHFADIDAALEGVRNFLVQFARSSPQIGPSK